MTDERRSTLERLSTAMVSGNLKPSKHGMGDAEYVAALGMASVNAHPAASAALHVNLALDRSAFADLSRAVMAKVRMLNVSERWMLAGGDLKFLASEALRYYLVPLCRSCNGLKYEKIAGTPALSPRTCRTCHGTGQHPLPKKYRHHLGAVLSWLQSMEGEISAAVKRRLWAKTDKA